LRAGFADTRVGNPGTAPGFVVDLAARTVRHHRRHRVLGYCFDPGGPERPIIA